MWSEADGLPGLVVDRYGPVVVIQCGTLGMARLRTDVVAALRSRLGDVAVMSMDDATMAGLEGFAPATGWIDRPGPDDVVVDEHGVRLAVRPGSGHKTGLYLDQADNRARVGARDRAGAASTSSPTPGDSPVTLSGPARHGPCAWSPRRTPAPPPGGTSS